MPGSLIPSFYIQNFARDVSSPITQLQAYRSGLIDENGDIVGQESSIDPYEYFVIKLKKIFSQLPGGMTKAYLASFLTTLKMFTEEASWYGIDKTELTMFLEGYISSNTDGQISYITLLEDMGTGGGAGALGVPATGSGINTGGVSGFDPAMGGMQRRKQNIPSFLDSCQMFDVCPEEYETFRLAKEWRNVPEGPTRNYLQRYQRRNPQGKLAVRNNETGKIHWITLKPKMITEERKKDNEQNRGVVDDYTDTVNDAHTNVAVLTNKQETGKAPPIEVTARTMRDTADAFIDEYKKARGESDRAAIKVDTESGKKPKLFGGKSAEKFAGALKFGRATPIMMKAIEDLGSKGEEWAAAVHGLMRYSAERSTDASDPWDVVGVDVTPEGVLVPTATNIKTPRATFAADFNPEDFESLPSGLTVPKIGNEYASDVMLQAELAGMTAEGSRIRRDFIYPYFRNPEVQARARELLAPELTRYTERHPEVNFEVLSRPGEEPRPMSARHMAERLAGTPRFRLSSTTTRGGKKVFAPKIITPELGRNLPAPVDIRNLSPESLARAQDYLGKQRLRYLGGIFGTQ